RWPDRYRIDDDKYIPGLAELVKVIHKHGCPTFMQMNHDGPWQRTLFGTEPFFAGQAVAASAVTVKSENDFHNEVPHAMTIAEIEEKIEKFVSAAVRAEKAGFDGVDINAASSHLGHNFLSPFWNRRTDIYGGNPENRARFVTNIIKGIKKRLGNDFPVSVCINGLEVGQVVGVDDRQCMTPDYSRQIGRILQNAGADAIQLRNHWMGYHVGAYLPDVLFWPEPPIPLESFPAEYDYSRRGAGANVNFAANMKKVVSIPVITVGRLDPVMGESIVRDGRADFIGMTRRLQADPELPNKVREGRLKDIAPCTACENCLGSRRCRINALMGTGLVSLEKAEKKKKVVVVGGGPAGMEAARVAAVRGHEVTLFEQSAKLGGLMTIAAVVKGSDLEDLPLITAYFERQLKQLGVKTVLGKTAGPADILALKPDSVILATGGAAVLPAIKGIENKKVISGSSLHTKLKFFSRFFGIRTLRWLTKFYMPVGKKVVIIGSGIQGCELAEFLTWRNRNVTIVDIAPVAGTGMIDVLQNHLFMWFKKKGVRLINGIKEFVEITDEGLTFIDKEGKKQVLTADSIIPALPLKPNLELLKSLQGKVPEVAAVGDCQEPLLIADAVGTGSKAARTL
ncbi:MAG TPA: FAD-dependent oxidoreductase, partial [Dehalococcoidales bacterium]|nr:FAD-dependent oxidoreductase [Dehalococcoidales bacterium]